MALTVETEIVHCDTPGCDQETHINDSIPAGWYFTVEDVKNNIATYTDYCPEHANGRKRNITPPEPGK